MTEDTDWLKKNPMMSLWRSSRFFGQDMDASLMANDQKSKNDVLVVSHMPRRSNIPMEKIKQMDFKFPAPVSKKTGIKKPVTKVSKFVVPQVVVSRPSINRRSGESKAGIQKQGFVKPNGRPSVLSGPGPTRSISNNGAASSTKTAQTTPIVTGKFNHVSVKSSADLSLLSQSKVVSQSTPNETAVLRSILKQKGNSGRSCARNLLGDKKSTTAKRVNFNGSLRDVGQGKENEESEKRISSDVHTEEGTADRSSLQLGENELKTEPDEESTVAFSRSFKPLLVEQEEESKNVNRENEENKENVVEKVRKSEGVVEEMKITDEIRSEKINSSFSGTFITGLMDLWKVYHNKVNHIRTELRIIDENFQRTLQLLMTDEIEEKFAAYDEEKRKLYGKLKELEIDFREKVESRTDIKILFSSYVEKKKDIFSLQSELEENFEKVLRTITEKYTETSGFEVENTQEGMESAEIPSEAIIPAEKTAKRVSGAKRKSGCNSVIKKRSTPRKRGSREVKASDGATPDNTPARRRKLSRKIEKQIRNLFEE